MSNVREKLDGSFSETLPPINPPASSTQNKSVIRERQKENTVSNIDKVLEHLNKKQKVTTKMNQIDENENYHGSRSTNQHIIHHEDRDYPATTDQHVVYPTQTQNTDAINLSVENCAQTYTNLGRYSW
ncbi:unnamed protein product [Macrosiphum euphorbiae]|uniref:Uncharacterized protein n=2 Tax=Macrosiphum euphorbiae TaxID=13131 RepID=A0AAV0XZ62_9HEMI|nr:unnamed protein product [Macrosiphum euphorbiae]